MGNVLEVTTMNRNQRRRHKKVVEWISSLSKDKQEILNRVVEERAEEKARKDIGMATTRLLEQVETAICGSIVKNLPDSITFDQILDVLKDFDTFLIQNGDFVKEHGEDWKMVLKKVEPKIVGRMESLLREGSSKKEIVEKMRKEFPNIKDSHVFNAFKSAQEKLRKELKEEITTDEAVNFVFENEINQELKEKSKVIVEEVTASVEKEIREMDVKEKLKNKLEEKAEIMKAAEEEQKKQNKIIEEAKRKIEIEKKKLEGACIDAEKIEKAIELIKDIDFR